MDYYQGYYQPSMIEGDGEIRMGSYRMHAAI